MTSANAQVGCSRVRDHLRSIRSMLQARRSAPGAQCGFSTIMPDMSVNQAHSNCMFCLKYNKANNDIMAENSDFYIRFDNFPATPGHVEIVPKRHVESFFELTQDEIVRAYEMIVFAKNKLMAKHKPDAYTIGINEGRAAGRSIDHLHIHLIPRYEGDVSDPRGGIRQIVPNCNPDLWGSFSSAVALR